MKLKLDRVIEKLRMGHYNRIYSAGYSNEGVILFDEWRFADNLGIKIEELYVAGILKKGDNCGWNIVLVPDYKKLKQKLQRLSK